MAAVHMRMTIRSLRELVREEVQRNMLRTAGLFGGGLSNPPSDGSEIPPPDLGTEEEERKLDGKEE